MAFTLGHTAEGFSPLHMRRSAFPQAFLRRLGEALLPRGDASARALASAGIAGLISLPLLMVSSLVLESPLAGPSAIALGYLACAHAIATGDRRRAASWATAVFAGLILWTLAILVTVDGRPGWPAIATALFAPLMAAAPALARLVLARIDQVHAVLAEQVACLNRLAPGEAILFLDRSGFVAAATRAALRRLDLAGTAGPGDMIPRLHILDRPLLLGALARSRATGEAVEIGLRLSEGAVAGPPIIATIECDATGTATARIREVEAGNDRGGSKTDRRCPQSDAAAGPHACCDIGMMIRLAMREVRPQADARSVTMAFEDADNVGVRGEPGACKGMLADLFVAAIGRSAPGGTVGIMVRRLAHAALLRVSVAGAGDRDASRTLRASIGEQGVEAAIERMGGSMIVEDAGDGMRVSVRLALANRGSSNPVLGEMRRRLRCV